MARVGYDGSALSSTAPRRRLDERRAWRAATRPTSCLLWHGRAWARLHLQDAAQVVVGHAQPHGLRERGGRGVRRAEGRGAAAAAGRQAGRRAGQRRAGRGRAAELQLDAQHVALHRLLGPPGLAQRVAQVVVRLREVRLVRDGLPVRVDGQRQLALLIVHACAWLG